MQRQTYVLTYAFAITLAKYAANKTILLLMPIIDLKIYLNKHSYFTSLILIMKKMTIINR